MLNIICGRAATGKTTEILNRIKSACKDGKNIVYIVPEQFSFESERAVLTMLGEKDAHKVNVMSFSSLADTLTSLCGGSCRSVLSDADKIMFMSKALKSVQDGIDIWKKHISSIGFASKIVDVIGEFKVSAITADELDETALKLDGSLKEKIKTLSLAYRTYDALIGERFIDPADRLTKLFYDLQKHRYFENNEVFIDGFAGFTGQQYKIIDLICAQANSVCVALLCDKENQQGLFDNTIITKNKITAIAKKYSKKIDEVYLKKTYFLSEGIKNTEEILSCVTDKNKEYNSDGVTLCVAKSNEDEVKFVARNIRRLVREKGYRYSDFVVIARDITAYENAVEREFDANGISCFFDKRACLTISPLFTLIDAAMECALQLSSQSVFRLLKTGLVLDITDEEISELENYVYLWDIDGENWDKQWDMDPTGFSKTDEKRNEEISGTLIRINALREKTVKAVKSFAYRFNGNVQEMSYAAVHFLRDINCADNMKSMIESAKEIFSAEDTDVLRQSWELIMQVFDGLVKCFGKDNISREQYREMFKTACGLTTVGRIPQTLDEVTFGAADRIRPSYPKIAFIMGANYGVFPSLPENNSVISNNDRRILKETGLEIRDKTLFLSVEENMLVYSCVCCASERLFISYSQTGVDAKAKEPSAFFSLIRDRLNNVAVLKEPYDSLCQENYPETKKVAFKTLCNYIGNNTSGSVDIAKALFTDKKQRERFACVQGASAKYVMKLSEENAKELFGNNISLSATKFDTYHTCRFRYFCRYGLDTDIIQPAKLDTLQRGTIVHFVLEQFCNAHLSDIENVSKEDIEKETDKYIGEYFESIKGSAFLFTARFNFLVSKIKEGIIEVIERIVQEFAQSKFRPRQCEVSIGNNGTIPTVTFPFSDDGKLSLYGSIDRLDSWGSFVRIVDYKTGSKTFELSDTLYGQNLQMLIYLYCVIRGNSQYKGKNPAGILYLISKKDLEKSGMAMNGLISENIDVVEAMEKENQGQFIPKYKLKKDGTPYKNNNSYIPEEAFDTIFDYIEELAKKMGQTLHSGDIDVEPVDACNTEACKYCNYSAVCGIEDEEHKAVVKLSNSDIIEAMRGGAEDET
ncbi:MAG: PD-(D/E)XK nuclease family protein [Acutalibacteraceae bacterium]|nr:PD-(D/E)XK nuclease family protein [Acutalibacteraceae bacterium]